MAPTVSDGLRIDFLCFIVSYCALVRGQYQQYIVKNSDVFWVTYIWQPSYLCHNAALSMTANCGISAPPGLMIFVLLKTRLYVVFSSCRTILIVSCCFMLYVVDGTPIRDQLLKRCVKFYESRDVGKNSTIQLSMSNSNFENTPMGFNMWYIAMHSKSKVKVVSEKDGAGHLLYLLLMIREHHWKISEFTREEVECMIFNVCTS